MQEKELLRKLCTSHGPSGREHWIYPIIKDAFEPFCDEVRQGNLNNAYAIKKGNGKASIMLMAHADEVFMQVDKICENGFVKFTTLGIDVKTLVSQEVLIHGKEKINGVIGIKPPHLMKEEERNVAVKVENLAIDTGRRKEDLQKLIKVGDFITLKRDLYELLNNNVVCKDRKST